MQLAREQDYDTVYIATVTARGIVEHLGWEFVQAISHGDEQTVLYRYDLEKTAHLAIPADHFAHETVAPTMPLDHAERLAQPQSPRTQSVC